VLSSYFGYNVLYAMNITDIDDKIIKRARQNFLYEKYLDENHSLDEILHDAKEVLHTFENTVKVTSDPDKMCVLESMLSKMIKAVQDLEEAVVEKNEKKIAEFQEVRITKYICAHLCLYTCLRHFISNIEIIYFVYRHY